MYLAYLANLLILGLDKMLGIVTYVFSIPSKQSPKRSKNAFCIVTYVFSIPSKLYQQQLL